MASNDNEEKNTPIISHLSIGTFTNQAIPITVELFDRDRSGGISYHELTSVMYALGQNMSHTEIMELFKSVDSDNNGEIDFEEFCSMMSKRQQAGKLVTEEEEIYRAFKLFDLNGDGKITSAELRKMMRNLGSDLSEDEVELLIREADYDGNGELDLEEFTRFMMTK